MKRYLWLLLLITLFLIGCSEMVEDPTIERIELSEEHLAYLESINFTVTMCVDPDWEPYELYEDGEFTGIAADLAYLVAARLGITFEIVDTEDWSETLRVSRGEVPGKSCQVLPFLNQTPAREEWLIFTEPIFIDPQVFITHQRFVTSDGNSNISSPDVLVNERIVLPEGTSVEERLREEFPHLQIITVPSEREVFEAVNSGDAEIGLRSRMIAYYVIRQQGFFNLRTAGDLVDYENRLRMGVLKDESILRDILNEGIATITEDERQDIINRYVFFVVEEPIDYGRLVFIGLSLIAVGLMAVIFERTLRRSHQERIAVLNRMSNVVWYMKDPTSVGFYNQAAKEYLLEPSEHASIQSLLDANVYPVLNEEITKAFETQEPRSFELKLNGEAQMTMTFRFNVYVESTRSNKALRATVVGEDITNFKRLIEERELQRDHLGKIIDYLPDPTFIIDPQGKLLHWNRAIEALTGVKQHVLLGEDYHVYSKALFGVAKPLLVNYLLDASVERNPNYKNFKQEHDLMYAEVPFFTPQGKHRYIEITAALVRDKEGHVVSAIETFRDVTEFRLRERDVIYLSRHDGLTQLLNRTYFDTSLKALEPKDYPLGVIHADLNNLKLINDDLGHAMGDRALKLFSYALQTDEASRDIIARVGGDEFIVVMPNQSEAATQERLLKIKEALASINQQHKIDIHVAFGWSWTDTPPADIEVLITEAEKAMYLDKEHYRKTQLR